MLSSIVLAAGKSSRMGHLKQLMPWRQGTIIEQVIDNLINSAADEVIEVLGYRAEDIGKVIVNKSVKVVVNPDFEQGLSTSIIAGLNAVDSRAQAVMIALGDQPLIDSQLIDRLIEEFHNNNKGIVIPTYHGIRGHPVIFAIKYKEKLLELKGDIGGRQIIEDHAWDTLEVPVNCEGVCIDVDTLNDYFNKQ